jgi:hypothetical protein
MVGMSIVCAPTELILAQFLVRLQRIFTPLVSGTVVLLIGLSLIPVGFHTMASGLGGNVPSWVSLAVSGLVLLLVLALNALNLPLEPRRCDSDCVRYRLSSLSGDWCGTKPTANRQQLAPGSRIAGLWIYFPARVSYRVYLTLRDHHARDGGRRYRDLSAL